MEWNIQFCQQCGFQLE
ncbi:hypothetical protein [Pedobacter sp. Leaf176]